METRQKDRQKDPEKEIRFHAVILNNNATELAKMMINNPQLGFLREVVNQMNAGVTIGPGDEILDVNPALNHHLRTAELVRQAAGMLRERPAGFSPASEFLLNNSAHHCGRIIQMFHEHPRAAGKASVG